MKQAILVNDTSHEAHIGSKNVVKVIDTLCEKNNIEIIRKLSRPEIGGEGFDIDSALSKGELIIINGEGSLHDHPRVSTAFFPYIMNNLRENQKAILINAVWQNMDYYEIKSHIKRLDLISFRESYSYNNFKENFIHSNLYIIPDFLFYFDDIDKRQIIGYGDSVLHRIRSTFKREDNYFPLGFIDSGSYRDPDAVNIPSIYAYITWLKTLDLYITGRFHGVCLAVLANVPFLTYNSNCHKIEGLLCDMGCEELLIKTKKDIRKKKEIAKELLPRAQLYLKSAKFKIENLFERISEL